MAVAVCALALLTTGAFGATAHTVRASLSSAGAQANAGSGEGGVAVSADGRFVAFVSDASNLVAGDTNGVADVFVRDLRSHTTVRVSISSGGAQADDASVAEALAMSPSGRFVTFTSLATNLAPGDDDSFCAPEPCPDVYIRDRRMHTTRILVPFRGIPMPGHMQLTAGARFYAYDTDGQDDVVRCRRGTRRCVTVSVLPPTVIVDEVDANSYLGGISSGGRFVEFHKIGFNEAPNPTSLGAGGVFVRDVRAHRTRVVTTHPLDLADGISPQGRFVLFSSRAGKIVPGDTNHVRDVFVRDLKTGATHRISVSTGGRQGNHASVGVGISSRGRYCLFESKASNLVPRDRNGVADLFLRNRVHARTIRVDVSTSGVEANMPVRFAAFSSDGRWAVFGSPATNLVPGDTNAVRDVFVRGPVHR
jgi:WD40-like Beta Propeller Repeat